MGVNRLEQDTAITWLVLGAGGVGTGGRFHFKTFYAQTALRAPTKLCVFVSHVCAYTLDLSQKAYKILKV